MKYIIWFKLDLDYSINICRMEHDCKRYQGPQKLDEILKLIRITFMFQIL